MKKSTTENPERRHATPDERAWVISQFEIAVGVPYAQCLTTAYYILHRDYSPWAVDPSYWEHIKPLTGGNNAESASEAEEQEPAPETAEEEEEELSESETEKTDEQEYAECLAIDSRLKDSSSLLRGLTRDQCKAFWMVMHTDLYDDKDLRDTAYTICLCSLRYHLLLLCHRHLIKSEADKDELLQAFFTKVVMGPITHTYDCQYSTIHTFVIRFCQRLTVKEVIGQDVKDSQLSASESDLIYQIEHARRELREMGVDAPTPDQISVHLTSNGQAVSTLQVRRALDARDKTGTEALSDNTSAGNTDVTAQIHNQAILEAVAEYKRTMLTPLEQACYDYTLADRLGQTTETIEQYMERVMPGQPVLKTQLERARRGATQKMDGYIRRLKGDKGAAKEIVEIKHENEAESLSKTMAGLSEEELNDLFD